MSFLCGTVHSAKINLFFIGRPKIEKKLPKKLRMLRDVNTLVILEIMSLYFCALCALAWAALIIFGLVMIHSLLEEEKNSIDAFFQATKAAGLTVVLGGVGAHTIIAFTVFYWRYCRHDVHINPDNNPYDPATPAQLRQLRLLRQVLCVCA